jgi:predicted transcriptional regulator with HTH domain
VKDLSTDAIRMLRLLEVHRGGLSAHDALPGADSPVSTARALVKRGLAEATVVRQGWKKYRITAQGRKVLEG